MGERGDRGRKWRDNGGKIAEIEGEGGETMVRGEREMEGIEGEGGERS